MSVEETKLCIMSFARSDEASKSRSETAVKPVSTHTSSYVQIFIGMQVLVGVERTSIEL